LYEETKPILFKPSILVATYIESNKNSECHLGTRNIHIAFSCVSEETTIFIFVVYAFTFYTQRRDIWSFLTDLITNNQGPWLLVGDFNATLGAHEKIGGRLPQSVACYDFHELIYY